MQNIRLPNLWQKQGKCGLEFRTENFDITLAQGTVELENGWKLALTW